ncbi:MAG: hypothetical protein ABSB84_03180 [Verrucomicrobiota bacterium]|jgi:hypothetical protein
MTPPQAPVSDVLRQVARLWLPRLLTQVCRDPSSPHFGCFDRDWWHYHIRDFPSIILQQGGYALHLASQLDVQGEQREGLRKLAAAACRFWNARATRRGAFEEYYPWEQGYPPLAFSLLAVMKLVAEGVADVNEVRAGMAAASRQLQRRFESQAANQQVAGLAALAWCRKVSPELVPETRFESLAARSLALQTKEGWFEEYGGPDLGYLSVTVDCLWDLFDVTGDERFLISIDRAVACIKLFTAATPAGSIGMHNSRNTDYLVPYGLVRAARQWPTTENVELVGRLLGSASDPAHFLNAVDDRYVCHYIGQSLYRAVRLLGQSPKITAVETGDSARAGQLIERLMESGHFLRQTDAGEKMLVTLRKGGIFSLHAGGGWVCDFGWMVEAAGRQFISHWWSGDWQYGQSRSQLWVEGSLYEHKDIASTPGRHLALRISSFVAGSRLIGALKKKLVFEKARSQIGFRRTLEWSRDTIRVVDTFTNLPVAAKFLPAPRSSKRHVSSADWFHAEDFQRLKGFEVARQFNPSAQDMEIVTVYTKLRERT